MKNYRSHNNNMENRFAKYRSHFSTFTRSCDIQNTTDRCVSFDVGKLLNFMNRGKPV